MKQHLVEYQEGNKLPSTGALPTLDDKVLDVSKVEEKDE